MMLTVSSQRSQSAVLLLSVLLALLAVSHGGNKSPKNQEPPLPEEYNYVTMEWVKFEGSVPTDAVSIREDESMYVCRNMQKKCSVGILKGSTCEYEKGEEVKINDPDSFEVLVNKDNFESLEWKKIQCTAEVEEVYDNAVLICEDQNLFIGRKSDEAKSLPAVKSDRRQHFERFYPIRKLKKTKGIKKLETLTGSCKVLTVSYENVKDQEIHDCVYDERKTKESESSLPAQVSDRSVIVNNQDTEVTQTVERSTTISQERRWDFTHTVSHTVRLNINIKLTDISSMGLDLSSQTQTSEKTGFSVKQDKTFKTPTIVKIPPKSQCTVSVVGRQRVVEIPFKTKLTRRFKRGDPKTITVSGRFVANNALDLKTVVEKCEPLDRNVASAGGSVPKKVIIVKDKQN